MTDRESFASARLGAVLRGKWRLDAILGIGGMATVYAATHRNGKRVAVKMLHPDLCFDADVKARFSREGYLANKVGHPGAVSVSDDDTAEDGSVFLVMDLLEGEPLDVRAARLGGTLQPLETLRIARDALDVLAAAHARGIVHRDLKPENLFLTTDGQLKILDFGIARLRELSNRASGRLTGEASMGTPAFMPPEQARGRWEEVDASSDLWSLGASMFTLLTGTLLHSEDTINEMMLAAMTKQPVPLRSVAPHLPEELGRLVDRALAFEKKDRFGDAREMQHAASEAYEALAGAPSSASAATTGAGTARLGPGAGAWHNTLGYISTSRFSQARARSRGAKLWVPVGVACAAAATLVLVVALRSRAPSGPEASSLATPEPSAAVAPAARAAVPPGDSPPSVTPSPSATASAASSTPVSRVVTVSPVVSSASLPRQPVGAATAAPTEPEKVPKPPSTEGPSVAPTSPPAVVKDPLDRRK